MQLTPDIEISMRDIKDIEFFIENYLVNSMNESGMSFSAMAVILQTMLDKIKTFKNILEENYSNGQITMVTTLNQIVILDSETYFKLVEDSEKLHRIFQAHRDEREEFND